MNEAGEIEKSMVTSCSSGSSAARIDDARHALALERPEVAPLARQAVGPGLAIDDRELGAAREARQRTADDQRARRRRSRTGRRSAAPPGSRAAAPARLRAARRRASFDGELKSMSRNTRRGAASAQLLDQIGVMAARPRPLIERREAGRVDADDHDVRRDFRAQQAGARIGGRVLERAQLAADSSPPTISNGERDQPPAVTAAETNHFFSGRRNRPLSRPPTVSTTSFTRCRGRSCHCP